MLSGFAQADTAKSKPYNIVEKMPEYPGGMKQMMKFVEQNLVYPDNMREKHIGGKVYIKFVVEEDGKIGNMSVLKSSGFEDLDDEAMRVLKTMPTWIPGTQNNKPVRVFFNVPIAFSLQEPYFLYDSKNNNPMHFEAVTRLSEKKYDEALKIYSACIKSDSDDAEAYYNTGVVQFLQKEKRKACKSFLTVIEKSSDFNLMVVKNSKLYIENYCR